MKSFNGIITEAALLTWEKHGSRSIKILRFAKKNRVPPFFRKNLDYGEGWFGSIEEIKDRRSKYLSQNADDCAKDDFIEYVSSLGDDDVVKDFVKYLKELTC